MSPENPRSQVNCGVHQPIAPARLSTSGTRRPVILVADDDAIFLKLVTSLMQGEGYSVLSAADGHEGLQLSRSYLGCIDLLITDVQMPRLNGIELCAHLFEERPAIKVMFITGVDLSEFAALDANLLVLTKPINGHALKAKVRAILADSGSSPLLSHS